MDKIMGLLTICRRAGKLMLGTDLVKDALRSGSAYCALAADDLSAKTLKELKYYCARYKKPLYALGLPMDSVSVQLGKRVGALAVCDAGFGKKAAAMLEEIPVSAEAFGLS